MKQATKQTPCEREIHKYDWDTNLATQVMQIESRGDATVINNNPATGDYSIGCFQVNIIGALQYGRPSEVELQKAQVNVKWAYEHWKKEGSFCKTSGWYNTCKKLGVI